MRGYRISFVYVVFLLGLAFAPQTRGQFPSARQFVQEEENLLPRAAALHNVELPLIYNGSPAVERKEKAELALRRVDLSDRMYHKPSELSGGQRQRVALARALVNDPSLLLADEPTGNLDSKTSIEIMKLFEQLHWQGNTIIVVTHEESIAGSAQRVLSILDGEIASDERSSGDSAEAN